jgi:hypothetical protein
MCITVLLFFLGVNKQLDFQSLLIIIVRKIAEAQGWFAYRRIVQEYFVIGISFGIGTASMIALFYLRNTLLHAWVECTGIAVLLIFAVIRAASISNIGYAIYLEEKMLRHIHAVELTGLALILASLFHNIKLLKNRSV